MTKKEKILTGLKIKIRDCNDEPNEVSWGDEKGILISKNDANFIVKEIEYNKDVEIKKLISEIVNINPYENLKEILGKELGSRLYKLVHLCEDKF